MRRSRSRLLARGSAAASVATFAALVSHVSAGGALPSVMGFAVPGILSLMVCILLAGKKLSLLRLSIAVIISQAFFHVLFVVGTVDATMTTTPGHDHAAMLSQVMTISSTSPSALTGDLVMWLGHGVAALVTIGALHRGERAVVSAAQLFAAFGSWLHRRVRFLTGVMPAIPAAPRMRAPRILRPRAALAFLRTTPRRGPPLFV